MSNFRLAVGDLTPALVGQIRLNGEIVDLTGATGPSLTFTGRRTGTTFTVTPTFVSPRTDGRLQYAWVDGDTDVADIYDYVFSGLLADGSPFTAPDSEEDPDYDNSFEIIQVPISSYATPISRFHKHLRILIGDLDDDVPEFSAEKLNDVVALTVEMGKILQDDDTPYEISSDRKYINPTITSADDLVNFTKLLLHSAKRLIDPKTRESFSIRAFSQSIGAPVELVSAIATDIYQLENGDGAS